jgi:hypothetical protein
MGVAIELPCNSIMVALHNLIKVVRLQRQYENNNGPSTCTVTNLITKSIRAARRHMGDYPGTLSSILRFLEFLNKEC